METTSGQQVLLEPNNSTTTFDKERHRSFEVELAEILDRELKSFNTNRITKSFELRHELIKVLGGDLGRLGQDIISARHLSPLQIVRRAIEAVSKPIPQLYVFSGERVVVTRPSEQLLRELLVDYRENLYGVVFESRLRQVVYAAIDYQAQGVARRYQFSEGQLDDLVTRAKQRVENKLLTSGAILSDYNLVAGLSIYSFLRNATDNIARNIIDEDRIPIHGMQSKNSIDMVADIERASGELGSETLNASNSLRSKTMRRHVSMSEIFESEDTSGKLGSIVPEAFVVIDETPIAVRFGNSTTRIADVLVPLLLKIASDMPGKIFYEDGKQIRMTMSHQLVWRKYLALDVEDEGLIGISTKDLSSIVDLSEATIKRRISECFAFLIQHQDYEKLTSAMLPNRLIRHADGIRSIELAETLAEGFKASLQGKGDHGKNQFRDMIHAWIQEHLGR